MIDHIELLKRLAHKLPIDMMMGLYYDPTNMFSSNSGKWVLWMGVSNNENAEWHGDTPEEAIEAAAAHECVDLDM